MVHSALVPIVQGSILPRFFGPRVAKRHRAVKNGVPGGRIDRVGEEIAYPLQLKMAARRSLGETWFQFRFRSDF